MNKYFKLGVIFEAGKRKTAQSIKSDPGYQWDGKNSLRKIPYNSLIDFDLNLPTLIINPMICKPTDYITAVQVNAKFFICSNDAWHELKGLNLVKPHQIYDIQIYYRKKYLDYKAIYFPFMSDADVIDFSRSNFYYYDGKQKTKEKLEFSTSLEYSKFIHKYILRSLIKFGVGNTLKGNLLVLRNDLSLDFFKLGKFWGTYCSQKFKSLIEEEGFTGFGFEDIKLE